jgi:hypothetical protein
MLIKTGLNRNRSGKVWWHDKRKHDRDGGVGGGEEYELYRTIKSKYIHVFDNLPRDSFAGFIIRDEHIDLIQFKAVLDD